MKTKPKEGQRVWRVSFSWEAVGSDDGLWVRDGLFNKHGYGSYKYNTFSTSEKAEEARKKIIRILRGEG